MTPYRTQSLARAIAHMGGAALTFSLLNATVKYLSEDYPTLQIVWARTTGHLLFVVAAFTPLHGLRLFATRHPIFQLARSLLLLTSIALYFTALRFVGLAAAATISFTSPIIVALLATPALGERVRPGGWAAIAAGFLGALIVIRHGTDVAQFASLLLLGSATSSALYQLLTRRVGADDPPETTVGYSALIGTVVMSLLVPLVWTPPRSAAGWLLLASLGLWGGLGHYLVARAYLWGPASTVAPFNYAQLVGAAAAGYLLFGDVPAPSVWIGAALIIGSGLFIVYSQLHRPRA